MKRSMQTQNMLDTVQSQLDAKRNLKQANREEQLKYDAEYVRKAQEALK